MASESSDQNYEGTQTRRATGDRRKSPASESARRESPQVDIKTLTGTTSRIVEQAAAILEEEIAAGVAAAKRMEERHVNVSELDSERPDEVLKRFRHDAQEVVDILINLASMATRSLGGLTEGAVAVRRAEPEKGGLGAPGGIPTLIVQDTVQ